MFEKIYNLKEGMHWVRDKLNQGPLILLYHRVAEMPSDPQLLCVSPKNFNDHLEVLKRVKYPIHLSQLVRAVQKGNLPKKAVIVTFDDGYADNLYCAKPLLENFCIPSTIFVTTGYVGLEREFWWDELERIFLQPGVLPTTLRLNICGRVYNWDLGNSANFSQEENWRSFSWNILKRDDPSFRHKIYRSLCKILRPVNEEDRQKVLDELRNWACVELKARSTHLAMNSTELIQLTKNGLVEVGAHTRSHSVLSSLSVSAQKDEISESKNFLENILGKPVISFAYPFGSKSDYTEETISIVKQSRFNCACSNFEGFVSPKTDFFQLPRLLVRNWSGYEFEKRISSLTR